VFENAKRRLYDMKVKHNTDDAKAALDAEGEEYDYYPDERAIPRFYGRLECNDKYRVELSIYQRGDSLIVTYAIVMRRKPNVPPLSAFSDCGCIIA